MNKMNLDPMNPDINYDQQKAIYTKDKNILVSAPAGSGKTKILVNRMMEHLLNDGYSVDNFLVVTFTAAAALEMKQRLAKAMDDYECLQEEKMKLPYAYITNFHGFCSTLLKKYGSLVGVPPAFEILEDNTLMKNKAYQECLSIWLEDQQFQNFVSLYFPGSNLQPFFSQLMNLVDVMHVIENRETYLSDVIEKDYSTCETDHWPVVSLMQEYLLEILESVEMNFEKLCEMASQMGIEEFFERPEKQGKAAARQYVPCDAYEDWIKYMKDQLNAPYMSYEALMHVCSSTPEKAYSIGWKAAGIDKDDPDRKKFEDIKKKINSSFSDVYKELYAPNNPELLNYSTKYLELFLGKDGYVDQFNLQYKKLKLLNNYLDFDDLEDYTIQLLDPSLPIVSLLHAQLKEVMVDEYQDTNGIQEKIIHLITQKTAINKFMVGDIKQSIYRFRRADPKLFNEKYEAYSVFDKELPESKNVRIDLHYNYRSNKIVLDSINYIFNMIMDEHIGDVRYQQDANHQLNYDFYRKKDQEDCFDQENRFDTELLLYDKSGDCKLKPEELEAQMVALRILDMVKNESLDTREKKKRSIDFRDIAILTRTNYSLVTFKKVFQQFGIPCHIVLSDGYYNSVEIKAMIALLDCLCNPYNDMNMVSVLRGYYAFSHFSEQEIYDLKCKYPKAAIYDALCQEDKYHGFLQSFKELQEHLMDQPAVLLERVYHASKYREMVTELYNGEQRKANLDLLMDYMFDHSYQSIPEIVHEINQKIELGSDSSPAMVVNEKSNMVQFMTIHKSKGLEFPIVFVCNMNHGMNKMDVKQPVIIDGKNGVALKPRGYEKESDMDVIFEYNNPYHTLLSKSVGKQSVSEEMRILYVAMTRACQKLIMTGGADEDYLNKNKDDAIFMNKFYQHGNYIIPRFFRNRNCYLDWVILAYFNHPDIIDHFTYGNFDLHAINSRVSYLDHENIRNTKLYMRMYSQSELASLVENKKQVSGPKEIKDYPILEMPEYNERRSTIAVTSLIDEMPYERVYSRKSQLTATERGSLIHQFFEYYLMDKNDVQEVIQYYAKRKLWNEVEVQELENNRDLLQNFIDSEVFRIMRKSDRVLREKEFSLKMEDGTVLHGTFDVLCMNDGEITIIDYKTDRVRKNSTEEELKEIHRMQMEYYKELIGKMYPECKVQAIVYYLEISRFVVL